MRVRVSLPCQAVDPLSFLRTIKDLDGNPIDVSVQQDAQGFLLDLFDKMEVRFCHGGDYNVWCLWRSIGR